MFWDSMNLVILRIKKGIKLEKKMNKISINIHSTVMIILKCKQPLIDPLIFKIQNVPL